MSSRFSEFLTAEKIDPRRLLVASRHLERLRPEDRAIRLKKRLGRKSESAASGDKAEVKDAVKRRSGRVVTHRLITAAQSGLKISGAQKTRLLRALNHVLQQKQREPVDLRKVF